MPLHFFVLFSSFFLKDNNFIIFKIFDDNGVNLCLINKRSANQSFFPILDKKDFIKNYGRFFLETKFFNLKNVSLLNFVLFSAGFNNCKHLSTFTLKIK